MTLACKECGGSGTEWFGTYDEQREICGGCDGRGWEYENEEEEWNDIAIMEEEAADE